MGIVSEDESPRSDDHRDISSDWNLDSLVSEMESILKKLHVFSRFPRRFVMGVSKDEIKSKEEDEDDLYLVMNENKPQIGEVIKNQVSLFETKILHETETFRSSIARVEDYREARKQVERRLDRQYRRKLAESLDTYLAVQERPRQEKVRSATIRAEEVAKKEADDQRKAAKDKLAEELRLEKHRLKKLRELEATNQWLKSLSNKDFSSFEKRIARVVKQICGTKDNVTAKANEIIKIFEDPICPVSISIDAFARNMVLASRNPFASSYVIVYVTSKFPQAMDILLAEFHKACVYTVPKHDDNAVVNSSDHSDWGYKRRIDSVMRLYGALVQTDIRGNIHGIEHGWAWLACFLKKTSTYNMATATALNAFLQTAGFGLHQRYKSQFLKAVNVVREHLLAKLIAEKDDSYDLRRIITDITAYLDDRMYLKEPQGRAMKTNMLSKEFNAQVDKQITTIKILMPSRLTSLL